MSRGRGRGRLPQLGECLLTNPAIRGGFGAKLKNYLCETPLRIYLRKKHFAKMIDNTINGRTASLTLSPDVKLT